MERIFDFVEHLTDFERLGGTSCIINSGLAIFRHTDCPFRQIARVDELHRIARLAGCHDFAAPVDAHWPIRKTISLIAWSDDKAWSDYRSPHPIADLAAHRADRCDHRSIARLPLVTLRDAFCRG